MWTKNDHIRQAFSEIGLSSYTFNVNPDDFETVLRVLDSMMATWDSKGFRLGYALPSSPSASNVDDESGLPDSVNEAVYLALSMRIAPMFGKTVSMETRQAAKQAYDAMVTTFAFPPCQTQRALPVGAGNRGWLNNGRTFFSEAPEVFDAGEDFII